MTWNNFEIGILRAHYPNSSMCLLKMLLGKNDYQIYRKANSLGLKKDKAYLELLFSESNKKLCESGKAHRFKKGDKPPNKGKKQTDYMSYEAIERTKATRFKKGNKPHNTREDATISARKDKTGRTYLYYRISLGKWVLYHRWLWEQKYGEIPPEKHLVFKDGDSTNVTLDNLELITRKENMKRNSLHNYPDEIKEVVYTLSGFKRRVKTILNQHGKE